MKTLLHFSHVLAGAILFLTFGMSHGLAAATLSQQIDPPEANVGDEVVVTITVQNGTPTDLHLPHVDGLNVLGTSNSTNFSFVNGSVTTASSIGFHLTPTRPGDFTIPAFDIHLQDGATLRAQPMKLHVVVGNGTSPSAPNSQPAAPAAPASPIFNPNGPVVMPPNSAPSPDNPAPSSTSTDTSSNVPRDTDGRPAKAFMVLTLPTTNTYAGQSIPMRIDFYLREDSLAQQDSLPTIKGSDFLMNNLSERPRQDEDTVLDEQYLRESWTTAISAPKSGDYSLQMERDTYWTKSNNNASLDPFGMIFRRPQLAHGMVGSNQFTIHVLPLPEEGRPANFTGAIGHFTVTGAANPLSVEVGEPVTLRFSVSGDGNFDYIRCPSLTNDPAWKQYVASSKIDYQDQARTQGVKTFEQAVIPLKNGTLPLPQASFSYFDPTTKQYTTLPVSLPVVTVTGTLPASVAPVAGASPGATAATPPAAEFLPNRLGAGSLYASLTPVYRQTWFWAAQGGLISALVLGTLFTCFVKRPDGGADRAERLERQKSLRQEEDAMSAAARRGDAMAFFVAARHAVQLQLGLQWRLHPEAITLAEVRQRDPSLAGTLEPLFTQADEIIYSGNASGEIDLAQWERHVRELLQPQPQPA